MTSEEREMSAWASKGGALKGQARRMWRKIDWLYWEMLVARAIYKRGQQNFHPLSPHDTYVRALAVELAAEGRNPGPRVLDEMAHNFYVLIHGHDREPPPEPEIVGEAGQPKAKTDTTAIRRGDLLSPAARAIWYPLKGEFMRLYTGGGNGLLPASEHRFYVREVAKLLASNRRTAPPPAILDELARNFYVMLNGHERGPEDE